MNRKIQQRLLLVNPPSEVYAASRIKAGISFLPQVSLAMLGAVAERDGHTVRALDLLVSQRPLEELKQTVAAYGPTIVGVTTMTPNFATAETLARQIKAALPGVLLVAGGAHPSALPEDSVAGGAFDIAVIGEGEDTLAELLAHPGELQGILGIAYRDNGGNPVRNPPRSPVRDLDALPMPAWHLFDLSRYGASNLTVRQPPAGSLETSRGCRHHCIYCSKGRPGGIVRRKSAARVVAEIRHAKDAGFRELHVWDDHFAAGLEQAKQVLRAIIDSRPNMSLNLFAGLRTDSVDEELMHLLKEAGCYQVALAPETGSEKLLRAVRKGITLDDSRRAFALARQAGLETIAFFMLGLPGETLETIEETISFAIELSPDYAKACFATPLPDTELFDQLDAAGRIKTHDWSNYIFHDPSRVSEHQNLTWAQLHRSYNRFYRRFYLRPEFILRRLRQGLFNGRVFHDVYCAIKTIF